MNLTISGHHLEVTPALREYVLTKLDRVTRHFDQVVDVNVLLSVERKKEKERRQKAEVTLHVKGRDIFCEQSHEDLYAAIDQLMDLLPNQTAPHTRGFFSRLLLRRTRQPGQRGLKDPCKR
jgi:putative sigma-54 modulation protein